MAGPVTTLSIDSTTVAPGYYVITTTDTLSSTASDAASAISGTFYVIDTDPASPACMSVPLSTSAPDGSCGNEGYGGPFTLSAGTHTVYYFSEDIAGITEAENISSFTVVTSDVLPPRTTLIAGSPSFGANPVYVTNATQFGFTAVDDGVIVGDGLGVGTTQTFYAIDASSFSLYASSFSLVYEGTHTISFFSVDLIGNAEIAKSSNVAVDLTAPIAALVSSGTRTRSLLADPISHGHFRRRPGPSHRCPE